MVKMSKVHRFDFVSNLVSVLLLGVPIASFLEVEAVIIDDPWSIEDRRRFTLRFSLTDGVVTRPVEASSGCLSF